MLAFPVMEIVFVCIEKIKYSISNDNGDFKIFICKDSKIIKCNSDEFIEWFIKWNG